MKTANMHLDYCCCNHDHNIDCVFGRELAQLQNACEEKTKIHDSHDFQKHCNCHIPKTKQMKLNMHYQGCQAIVKFIKKRDELIKIKY